MVIATKSKAGVVKTFKCPNCGGSVRIAAVGISINAVCQSCGSVIDVTNENYQIIEKAKRQTKEVELPLGTRGKLFGIEWEVIGYQQKSEDTETYFWDEYLLFNPYHGFRFLVESDGHWSFIKLLTQDVAGLSNASKVEYDGRSYDLFTSSGAKVQYVMGEFYWQIKTGDETRIADYIHPPYILSREISDGEITWSHGEYVDRNDIRDAFNLSSGMTPQSGIGENQPSPYKEKIASVWILAAIFVVALIAIDAIKTTQNMVIYAQNMTFQPSDKGQDLSVDLDVPSGRANLEFEISSPVNNNWVELDMALVSEEADKKYDILQSIEYYSGYDSDGAWTEGSQRSNDIISSIPGGKYKLILSPESDLFNSGQSVNVGLQIKRDVPVLSNFLITLIMILLYPLFLYIMNSNFEKQRWANSDSAPADSSSGSYKRPDPGWEAELKHKLDDEDRGNI